MVECFTNSRLLIFCENFRNRNWLESNIVFRVSWRRGRRPILTPSRISSRSLRGRLQPLSDVMEQYSTDEIIETCAYTLQRRGFRTLANQLRGTAPTRPGRVPNGKKKVHIEKALSMLIKNDLSKSQYLSIRDDLSSFVSLPGYHALLKEKEKTYPEKSQWQVTESHAEVSLQGVLDHTVTRLASIIQGEMFENLHEIRLISKWGMDGSSGHANYRQTFNDDSTTDDSVLLTSFVPIRLVGLQQCGEEALIWQNPKPCSTRYFFTLSIIKFIQRTVFHFFLFYQILSAHSNKFCQRD